jgi:hypothetical protein
LAICLEVSEAKQKKDVWSLAMPKFWRQRTQLRQAQVLAAQDAAA